MKCKLKNDKSILKNKVRTILLLILGNAMTAMAISLFLVPNKIVNGGVSGLATVIYYTISIKPSISNALINIFLLLISLKCYGKSFVARTLLSVGMLTTFIEIFSYVPPVTDDMVLATIFGAAFYGLGIGIVLSQGSTTGGTDILGRIIQYKRPRWPIGKVLLGVDLSIVFLSFVTFRTTETVLYGIVALVISTTAIDTLIKRLNISKLAFVITDKGREISDLLVRTSPRGVTSIEALGGYSNSSKQVLICALKENELTAFQRKVLEKDNHAFIIYSESQQIVGNGFYIYG